MCAEVCEEVWEVILKNVNRKKFDYSGSIELQKSESNTLEIGIALLKNKRNKRAAPGLQGEK